MFCKRRGWGILTALAIILLTSLQTSAQTYGNEWINYAQQYYKIPVTQQGIYRLTYQDLTQAGLPLTTIDPRRIQIFHRGVEQSIFVSGESDAFFDEADYVEFYGKGNDGTLDAELYRPAEAQPHKYYNLYSDTTYYFITWRLDNGLGKRMSVVNESNTNNLTVEAFHWAESILVLKSEYDHGKVYPEYIGNAEGEHSFYDYGEGWTGAYTSKFISVDYTLANLGTIVNTSYKPKLEVVVAGRNNYSHVGEIFAGSSTSSLRSLGTVSFSYHNTRKLSTTIETADLSASALSVRLRVNGTSDSNPDAMSVSLIRLIYPQAWDMAGSIQKTFTIEAGSTSQHYFEINNPTTGTLLYDITSTDSPRRITATTVNGKLAATLSNGTVVFANANASSITGTIKKVSFRNFSSVKPNYLIVTNSALRKPVSSVADPVQAYAEYRASTAGGGYDTLIANVDQLYNQFSYGEYTPVGIARFVKWMYNNSKPGYLFIIGRGISPEMVRNAPGRATNFINVAKTIYDYVPSDGKPGSDYLFSDTLSGISLVPGLATGRISALEPQQVYNYLVKVKEHEALSPNEVWRKNIIHLSGGHTAAEVSNFKSYIDSYKSIIEGEYFGGKVQTLSKQTGNEVEQINISQQLNEGASLVTMFGHSGRTVNDIEIGYATDEALGYKNQGKYPLVLVNGCQSGDVFNNQYTYAEDWVMGRSDRGAIAWIAHSSAGYASELHAYSTLFYQTAFADSTMLGKSIGNVQKETIRRYVTLMTNWTLGLTHAEQMVLQGDPAVVLVPFSKPDYAITETGIFAQSFDGSQLTAAVDSFRIGVVVTNYGKTLNKKFGVTVTRRFGDGTIQPSDTTYFNPISFTDTVYVTIANTQKYIGGTQTFTVFVDPANQIDESNEQNNQASKEIDIPIVGAIPLFPREYSIVSSQPVKFVAQSTITPLETRSYKIELDTSATFSSAAKIETTVSGSLLVNWETDLLSKTASHDSTVYYWRISLADRPIGNDNSWMESSFIYINKSPEGWSQTKFPQFSKAGLSSVKRNTETLKWEFTGNTMDISVKTYGYQNQTDAYKQVELLLNEGPVVTGGRCSPASDPNTLIAVAFHRGNVQPYSVVASLNCGREPFAAHYLTNSYIAGGGLADFINQVGSNDYILLFTAGSVDFTNWSAATKQLLVSIGSDVSKINNLKSGDPYIIIGQKGATAGSATEIYPDYSGSIEGSQQAIALAYTLQGRVDNGVITSSLIGPASLWGTMYHTIQVSEKPVTDQWQLDIVGVNLQGAETVVATDVKTSPLSIDFINSQQYPYLKLRLQARDETNLTPPQLKKWQVIYDGVPEGLINTGMVASDAYTIPEQMAGGSFEIPVVFQNISPRAFTDSLTVQYTILNAKSKKTTRVTFKARPLAANGDTLAFKIPVRTDTLSGNNELQVFVNPRILPEQNYANNVLSIPFVVNTDNLNPILEVTFDGQKILNGDIVSPTPQISMRLKDENTKQIRTDTSGILIYIKKPGSSNFERISGGAFSWAAGNGDNDFRMEWNPEKLSDGVYTLKVFASDLSGNQAGSEPFQISFEVVNESTITHFYPYPNPFSSGTRFVFTLTGASLPDQIKIQIMTVSGKVVREITQDELGPIHIGNNISSYVWDGSDEFGDKLANGVYIYRVVTRMDGQAIEHRATSADKAFKKDYGKLYILR
ncbi:putative type IX secretion system sortase PorU2 [Xanthocytophaga flava]|uniref:putative type IX secretion system sortase PorU2 n=1 Tax=Xanthocytophaga flava TaxID=3048013 RepID=UPI0028D8AD95|nr:C25 family cysteine peptidase [Xanthocytophaga flavus]MDJ1471488.1 C25 family cysteine peptidase [Xanthocytophaga flavus]